MTYTRTALDAEGMRTSPPITDEGDRKAAAGMAAIHRHLPRFAQAMIYPARQTLMAEDPRGRYTPATRGLKRLRVA